MKLAYRGFVYESVESQGVVNVNGVVRSSFNSRGDLIHPTQEGVIAFWNWFGDSKTVDGEGRPMVFYHGSYEEFEEFQMPWDRDDYDDRGDYGDDGYSGGNLGIGFYFTTTKQYAERFGRIKEYYIRIVNLLDLTDEDNVDKLNERFQEERDELSYGNVGEVIDEIVSEGRYDGVYGRDAGGLSYGADEWLIVDGKQAKLITNQGTFDSSAKVTTESSEADATT